MRLVFMGTPAFAVPTLTEIVGRGHEVRAVYTRAPAPKGRGMGTSPSDVHVQAERFGLQVFTPASLRAEAELERFRALDVDVAVVVAYGLILPPTILDTPHFGCLNLHGSLLPRWRGAAPIQRAVMAGDGETGVMVMRMETGLDTGPIAMAERVAITPDMTGGELHDRLAPIGADLMLRALAALERGSLDFRPQASAGVTYAHKIDKAECRIDWARAAGMVHNHVRALSPFPGAYFEADFGRGRERVKVIGSAVVSDAGNPGTVLTAEGDRLVVACETGALRLLRVQRAGKPPMRAEEFLRGTPVRSGAVLPEAGA